MKKLFKTIMVAMMLTVAVSFPVQAASYPTYTQGPGGTTVPTQTAYVADEISNLGLAVAEDLFYDREADVIYIADTGNARVLAITAKGEITGEYGTGTLSAPTGVVTKNDKIYVADKGAQKICIFDMEGALIQEIGHPQEAIYGKSSSFVPVKVDVDDRGNIYCISEGNENGVLQFAKNGDFTGYIGANTAQLTFSQLVKNIVFTKKQKAAMMKTMPTAPTSVAVNNQGLLHVVTNSASSETVKKLNTIGNTIVALDSGASSMDVAVDENENMFVLDGDGYVSVYDSFGEMLFMFGGKDLNYERLGFLRNPSAVDVDPQNNIYVLDKDLNMVVRYCPTSFAHLVFEGTNLYKDGLYVESKEIWEEILKQNSSFILSYKVIAKANEKLHDYDTALRQFRIAEDNKGYSDAFWQLRNRSIQKYAGTVVILFAILVFIWKLLKLLHKKTGCLKHIIQLKEHCEQIRIIKQLKFTKYMMRHPIDGYYEIKRKNAASGSSAAILLLWYMLINLLGVYVMGFLFRSVDPHHVNLISYMAVRILPVALWISANYLVSTITEGEGTLKQVYVSSVYAMSPYLRLMPVLVILTNILTYNEKFVYSYASVAIYAWCLIYIFIMVMEIHSYSVGETVKNILVTLFTIAIIVLFAFIIYVLFHQVTDYIISLVKEALIVYER